jgi:hypothetical protein
MALPYHKSGFCIGQPLPNTQPHHSAFKVSETCKTQENQGKVDVKYVTLTASSTQFSMQIPDNFELMLNTRLEHSHNIGWLSISEF